MHIAAYVRVSMVVSPNDQNEQRQIHPIRQKYSEEGNLNEIDWYCDLGESGASPSRSEYQRLREHVDEDNVVVAYDLNRLGRSFADLAGFVHRACVGVRSHMQMFYEKADIDIDSEYLKLHGTQRELDDVIFRIDRGEAQDLLRHHSLQTAKDAYSHIAVKERAEPISDILDTVE